MCSGITFLSTKNESDLIDFDKILSFKDQQLNWFTWQLNWFFWRKTIYHSYGFYQSSVWRNFQFVCTWIFVWIPFISFWSITITQQIWNNDEKKNNIVPPFRFCLSLSAIRYFAIHKRSYKYFLLLSILVRNIKLYHNNLDVKASV